MRLGDLRLVLLRLQSHFWGAWARWRGAQIDGKVRFVGRPQIRIERGGQLILSEGVTLVSNRAINPLIGRPASTLWVMTSRAVMELGPRVGCSGVCLCAAERIEIGEGSILGADCLITDNDFHLPGENWSWLDKAAETARPIKIGRGCFIGARAIILKGVTIGDGAVVGAGAVVSRDVPAGHLAAGNPAVCRPLAAPWLRPEL
jgi:acetyltransferase-like isoleucine patch superfamily enzyme